MPPPRSSNSEPEKIVEPIKNEIISTESEPPKKRESKKQFERDELQTINSMCNAYLSQYRRQFEKNPNGEIGDKCRNIQKIKEKIKELLK